MSVPAERWRRPIKVVSIDDEVLSVFTDEDGEQRYRPVYVLGSKDDYDRIRLGYACAMCLEPFERPFPDRCVACGFKVKRDQLTLLNEELKGEYRPLEIASGETVIDETIDLATGRKSSRIWTPNDY